MISRIRKQITKNYRTAPHVHELHTSENHIRGNYRDKLARSVIVIMAQVNSLAEEPERT